MKPLQILLYSTPKGAAQIEVFFEDETFWQSQKIMADLFGVDVRTISEHLQNIFNSGELDQNSVIRKTRKTAYLPKSPLNPLKPHQDLQKPIAVEYKSNIIEQIKTITII